MDNTLQLAGFRPIALTLVLLMLSACGQADRFSAERVREGDAVAYVSVDYDAQRDPYQMQITRERDGYALEAPLHSEGNSQAHMRVSRTREHSWFIGPQLSFSF